MMTEFEIECLNFLLSAFESCEKDNMEFKIDKKFVYTVPAALRKAIELLKTIK